MKSSSGKIINVISKTPVLLVFVAGGALGYMFRDLVTPPTPSSEFNESTEQVDEIWTCSMHPQIRLPEPGKCPICSMDLVLAEASSTTSPTQQPKRQPKYACSMFCVPPLPEPGQCPVCGMDMVEVDVEEGTDDQAGANPRTLTLSPTARALARVQVAPVERKFVATEIRMVGKIEYDETRLRYITAWVPGRLDRLYVDYTGVPVQNGDHLVYLYSPELQTAQTELLEAIKGAIELEASDLKSLRGTADRWVEDIRTKFRLWGLTDEQIAEIERRGTPSDHMTIYAPISGIVIHKSAVEGMYVQTGTRIYTIADLSRVWVKLDAYESDLAWVRYGQEVSFETEAYPGEIFTGKISFIDPVLDGATRTVKVRVNVDNADGRLKPEMFVRAVVRAKIAEGGRVVNAELAGKWISPMHPEIVKDGPGSCDVCGMPLVRAESLGFVSVESGEAEPPLVIPTTAPLLTGKRAVVYTEAPDKPGVFEGREVTLGPRAGDYYIVRAGLALGDLVVVNGNFRIDSAMQILARPSMMSPDGGAAPAAHDHGGDAGAGTATDPTSDVRQPDKHASGPFEVTDAFRAQLDEPFAAYLRIQSHLSHDRSTEARQAAGQLSQAVKRVDTNLLDEDARRAWEKEADDISKTAAAIQSSSAIDAARSHFALLSESMTVVARRFGTGTKTTHRFHCPMAFDGRGADWIQTAERAENPYFGAAMFRCGVMKASYEPSSKLPAGGAHGH